VPRGLSHLAVLPGKEAEFLNRELVPYVRDLAADLAALQDRMTAVEEALEALATAVADLTP
jgi:hypothetical protein